MNPADTDPSVLPTVRAAWAADAPQIARVQVAALRQRYGDVLGAAFVSGLDEEAIAAKWSASLDRPGDARNRVLVALPEPEVVGFAMTGPGADPDSDPVADGEVHAFHVAPDRLGQGHGSRLLQASMDTLRADRFERAVTWLFSTDDAMRAFLTSAGWAPDGAHRELDLHGDGTVVVKQIRLHCSLRED